MIYYYIIIDGYYGFVGTKEDIEGDHWVMFASTDFDQCCELCDDYNDMLDNIEFESNSESEYLS